MRCLFVYNPVSGKGKINGYVDKIQATLTERFGVCDVYETGAPGELSEQAAAACGVYDVLVFAGGDGSFNEVVQGLGERDNRPMLGYIPTGTVNDIARSTGIKRNIKAALKNIVNGTARPHDVMKVNDNYVMYVVASGGLTGCSYTAKQAAKKKAGKLAYVAEVFRHYLKIEDYTVKFEDANDIYETTAVMVMIMNGRSVASMNLNPNAVLDDGEVEIMVVKQRPHKHETNTWRHIRYFFSAARVFIESDAMLKRSFDIFVNRGKRFKIDVGDDIVWNFDGERGVSGPIELEVLPRHIDLIVPNQ